MLSIGAETGCDEIRHLDQGAVSMRSKKKFLSALAGLSLLGMPLGAMAGVQFSLPSTRVEPSWQSSMQPSPMIFAQAYYQYEWHHHHHRSDPPSGGSIDPSRAYLEQRRQAAINMQQQMLARGDMQAAQRLGGVIAQLDSQLRYR